MSSSNHTNIFVPSTKMLSMAPEGCLVFDTTSGGFVPWDNPDNILSQNVERTVDTVVGYISLMLCFVSFPCNILNMIVFWRHGVAERINLCLFCLSLADFTHMLLSFLFNVDRLYMPTEAEEVGPVLRFITDHYLVGIRNIGWLSGFISMVIACERCLCVVSPLRSKRVLKTKTTAGILVGATVPIAVGKVLLGVRWSFVCVYDLEANITYHMPYTGRLYTQYKTALDILSFTLGGVLPFIYIVVITATTTVTAVKLKETVSWRTKTSSSTMSSREVALTRTLIAISILFVVCSLPIMMTGTMTMFVKDFSLGGRYANLTKTCVDFFELASYVNATFNFFVYLSMGSKYRQTLQALFHCDTSVSE